MSCRLTSYYLSPLIGWRNKVCFHRVSRYETSLKLKMRISPAASGYWETVFWRSFYKHLEYVVGQHILLWEMWVRFKENEWMIGNWTISHFMRLCYIMIKVHVCKSYTKIKFNWTYLPIRKFLFTNHSEVNFIWILFVVKFWPVNFVSVSSLEYKWI